MSANEAPPSRCFACNQESDAPVYFEKAAWLCPACDDVFQQLRTRLAKVPGLTHGEITPHTRIAQTLGGDSLDHAELFLDIFDHYRVPDDCVGDVFAYRVADVIAYIRAHRTAPPL